MDPKKTGGPSSELEGEGSQTADKSYRDAATRFAGANDTIKKGLEAEREVEKNPAEYARAEERGKAPGKGDDLPDDIAGKDFKKNP